MIRRAVKLWMKVKKSVRRDRREHVERMTQDEEDAAERGDMRELYQITKRLAGKKSTQNNMS